MTALVFVLMMAVVMGVLVGMHPRFMDMLMAIMGVGNRLVLMWMLMFVFGMAAHSSSPPFPGSVIL
jgi:hypothetical protein